MKGKKSQNRVGGGTEKARNFGTFEPRPGGRNAVRARC